MRDKELSRISRDLFHHLGHHSHAPAYVAAGRRHGSATSPCHGPLNSGIWHAPGNAPGPISVWSGRFHHWLEVYLLDFIRPPIHYTDLTVSVHAGLSTDQSWREFDSEVSFLAMGHRQVGFAVSSAYAGLPDRLFHIVNIYELLDDSNLSAGWTTISLLEFSYRYVRPHRHSGHDMGSHFRENSHGQDRSSIQCPCRRVHMLNFSAHWNLYRQDHRCRTNLAGHGP